MSDVDLKRLLDTYRFLDTAVERHAKSMPAGDREGLEQQRAAAFRRLLTLVSSDPAVTVAQMRTLLECLAGSSRPRQSIDAELQAFLITAARRHLDQLGKTVARRQHCSVAARPCAPLSLPASWIPDRLSPDDEQARSLNALASRIAIFDTDYRYRFTNAANASFHGTVPASFIDQPLWATTSEAFFARVSKPALDRCLAGHASAFVAPHPGRDPGEVYSCHLDPIRDAKGQVLGVMGIARRIDVRGD